VTACTNGHPLDDNDAFCGICGSATSAAGIASARGADGADVGLGERHGEGGDGPTAPIPRSKPLLVGLTAAALAAVVVGVGVLNARTKDELPAKPDYGTASCRQSPDPFDASLDGSEVTVDYGRSGGLQATFDTRSQATQFVLSGDNGGWSLVAEYTSTPFEQAPDTGWTTYLEGDIQGVQVPEGDGVRIYLGGSEGVTQRGEMVTIEWPGDRPFGQETDQDGQPLQLDGWSATTSIGDTRLSCADQEWP
jgi:hypothetical protein